MIRWEPQTTDWDDPARLLTSARALRETAAAFAREADKARENAERAGGEAQRRIGLAHDRIGLHHQEHYRTCGCLDSSVHCCNVDCACRLVDSP